MHRVSAVQRRFAFNIFSADGREILKKFLDNGCDFSREIKWRDRDAYVLCYSIPGDIHIVCYDTSIVPSPKT
jgi:hypothetical protein